jgi:hypothetical protein
MNDDLASTGLTKELSGVPVMQLEIRNAVERDGIIYNAAGILAGCLIAIVFFRKVSFMVAAAFRATRRCRRRPAPRPVCGPRR